MKSFPNTKRHYLHKSPKIQPYEVSNRDGHPTTYEITFAYFVKNWKD